MSRLIPPPNGLAKPISESQESIWEGSAESG